ncbi:MAG: MBL fold metallo-hydrolase [Saprospiraceae bacterium]|nr:MBL fold metallo-hydrolase [Saprospiraceae bacterium]
MTIIKEFNYEEIKGFKFGKQLFGKPKMFSHIYFIDGLLIDTGHSQMRKEIIKTTEHLAVQQIFTTHHHEDHTGNVLALRKQFNCKAYAPTLCCEIMKNPPKISFAQKITWGERPPIVDLIPKDTWIKTPNHQFQIIPIPGHAIDMVALYEPRRKWLFSSDLYVNSYIGYFLNNECISTQIASIRSILALDFDVLLCSHNPQLKNGKQQLVKKLQFLETFFERVALLYNEGLQAKEIFRQLKLKENNVVKLLSGGSLSKMNMVKSVLNHLEVGRKKIHMLSP